MAATDFIVAIELGSSKITGIAGKKHADGSIQVLALASENSSDFIRKGVIYNLDKTAQSLTSIIKKLESTLKASIGKVYVGIGGQSLRTIRNTEVRHLEEETKISQELIDSIMDSNREVPIIDQEILEVAPQEYKVGINLLADPVGVPSDHIEGRFLNIIARSSVKQNIDKCFKQAPRRRTSRKTATAPAPTHSPRRERSPQRSGRCCPHSTSSLPNPISSAVSSVDSAYDTVFRPQRQGISVQRNFTLSTHFLLDFFV